MFAQYSPLFTSGLLSDASPSSSRAPSPKCRTCKPKKQTHDSLPLTVSSATFSLLAGVPEKSDEDAIFLTFKPSRQEVEAGRSFLSLDLAESHRSMSLRRKDTITTAHGRSVPTSPVSVVPSLPAAPSYAPFQVPSTASSAVAPISRRSSPILRRGSRETLCLPSPKPAPSTTLPEVPAPRHRRRPSNLTLTFSACFPDVGSSSSSMGVGSYHRSTNSEPAILSPSLDSSPLLSPGEARSYFASFSPSLSAPPTPPLTGDSAMDMIIEPMSAPATSMSLRIAPSFRSVVSVNTRQRNRSDALAALEGRSPGRRRPSIRRPRNFMSMSDDEDDEDDPVEVQKQLLTVLTEEEDVVIPAAVRATTKENVSRRTSSRRESKRLSTSSEGTRGRRRSTIESFFSPLTNFIDLRDDESSSRSWRSFVEFSA